ncbi:MAG: CPBP family intramembrane glutamic endopeptidase [Proteocatella sp.]
MRKVYKTGVVNIILIIYAVCAVFRGIEYMVIRTDKSILGEAFIHKLIGILILAIALKVLYIGWKEIGFDIRHAGKYLAYGILLGLISFVIAYGVEFWIHYRTGVNPSFEAYVTSYSIDGNIGKRTSIIFFGICILGNIINVIMEEGIFRGLFLNLAERECTFFGAVAMSSVLFGLWHVAAPIRSFLDREISLKNMCIIAIMLVFVTGLTGIKFCLLTKISGSLWMPMADHFVNNTVINLIHMVTFNGADELMGLRIMIAQTVSFLIVIGIFIKSRAWEKKTFR